MTRRITLERTYRAPLEDVWELWTTKDGIESWWGPDGFEVKVKKLDLRPGGELLYSMIAIAAPQIEFMKKAGMPLSTEAKITYDEIVPLKLLRYTNLADFIPGVAAYNVGTVVELAAVGDEVKLTLVIDAMHDEGWTKNAVAGWEMELTRLGSALANRSETKSTTRSTT